jgi:hypothetical protein
LDIAVTDKDKDPPQISEAEAREELLSGLLASDLAMEIGAEFDGRRAVGFDVPAATGHVLGKFRSALSDPQDGPVVLIALAALQMRAGWVQAVIRDAAVDLIDSGEAAAAYKSTDFSHRKSVGMMLEQFAELLGETQIMDD